jgi:hypothetical protein
MLNFISVGMVSHILKQHIGFILNHKFDMKNSPLDHEVSAFLQNLTWQSPGDVASHPTRLEFIITHCEWLYTCKHAYVEWKGTVWIVNFKNMIIKIPYLLIKHLCRRDILFEVNVEFYLFNINFVTSDFLDICHEKQTCFLYILFRTRFTLNVELTQ